MLHDVSVSARLFLLDSDGFRWVHRPTSLTHEMFDDPTLVRDVYLPEVKAFVQEFTGAIIVMSSAPWFVLASPTPYNRMPTDNRDDLIETHPLHSHP